MKALTTTVARIIYAVPFGIFGLLHLMNGSAMAAYVPKFIPGGVFWVYVTGLALIAASIAIISGKYARLASLLLALMLAIFVITIHLVNLMSAPDQMAMQLSMTMFLKDTALAGAALVLAGVFDEQQE